MEPEPETAAAPEPEPEPAAGGISIEQQVSFLRECPTIANLPETSILLVAQRMKIRKYAAGETIIRKGDEGTNFFMIKMGNVGFSMQDDSTVQSTRGKGDFFGELALLQAGCVRSATAVAMSAVECFVLSRDTFNALLREDVAAAPAAGVWRTDTESLNRLESCFRLFDKDGDGGISAEELKNVSCNLGEQTSYEMAQEMIAIADSNGDGQLGFDEFVLLMTGQLLTKVAPHLTVSAADEEAAEVQRLFDAAASSGALNSAGMVQLATQLCDRQLLPDIRKRLRNNRAEVMDEISPDGGDDRVTYPQFRLWMQAMNRHWTDLLVLPEGLVFAVRADAEGRCQLPEAVDPESRWKRLGILLWLMSAHQKWWGDVRQLYGQAPEGSSKQKDVPAANDTIGFSEHRLATTAPKRDADGVFSSWQEDLTVRASESRACRPIDLDLWTQENRCAWMVAMHAIAPPAEGICTHLTCPAAAAALLAWYRRNSTLLSRSRGIELASSQRIRRCARPGTGLVSLSQDYPTAGIAHSRCLVLSALAGCSSLAWVLRRRWAAALPAEVPLLLYVFVMVPYRTSFELEVEFATAEFFVELMVDVYFVVDIVMNFRTGGRGRDLNTGLALPPPLPPPPPPPHVPPPSHHVSATFGMFVIIAGVSLLAAYFDTKTGELVLDNSEIAKNYLTGWFAIDLVRPAVSSPSRLFFSSVLACLLACLRSPDFLCLHFLLV